MLSPGTCAVIDTDTTQTDSARMLSAAIALVSAAQTCTVVEQRCRVGNSNIGIACQPLRRRVCKPKSKVLSPVDPTNVSVQETTMAARVKATPVQKSNESLWGLLGLVGLVGLIGLKK